MRKSTPQAKFVAKKAKPHTPPYQIHRYFARRPWNIFNELVNYYSKQGDVILDPFCGGGVTVYESLRLCRNVIGCDLNPLSIFIIKNMFHNIDLEIFENEFQKILNYLKNISRKSFEISCPSCNKSTLAHWYNLAHRVKCNKCNSNILLIKENKISNGKYRCSNTKCQNSKTGFFIARIIREKPTYLNLNGKCEWCHSKFTIPINHTILSRIDEHILNLKNIISTHDLTKFDKSIPLNWDRQAEDLLYVKGFKKFRHLFTEKNFLLNVLLLKEINRYKKFTTIHNLLRFIFSASLRDTNIMSFVVENWQNGTPNTWAKHAYWTPAEFCEINPVVALSKSFKSLKKCIEYNIQNTLNPTTVSSFSDLKKKSPSMFLKTGTISDLKLPKNIIDVIITDPPYGSNVQYLELSQFWHMWNQDLYENSNIVYKSEAIVNRKQSNKNSKTYATYEENLYQVFNECYRILKNNGKMVMTFNNKDLNSWLALLISVARSGFNLNPEKMIFQDGVSNYKHTAHTGTNGSPFGDFIYEFSKTRTKKIITTYSEQNLADFINKKLIHFTDSYKKEHNRNQILIRFFKSIMPKIELFVHSKNFDQSHSVYNIFTKKHLYFLYEGGD